jgi:hypothetical protein
MTHPRAPLSHSFTRSAAGIRRLEENRNRLVLAEKLGLVLRPPLSREAGVLVVNQIRTYS